MRHTTLPTAPHRPPLPAHHWPAWRPHPLLKHRPPMHASHALVLCPFLHRFCNSELADWKASLTPESLKPEVQKVQPIMVVYFEGEIHR